MRVERFIVLVATAIVAVCVIVTGTVLPEGVPIAVAQFGPPFVHIATPRPEAPPEPTVPCPPPGARVELYNQHSWIDHLGQRNQLDCGDGTSITRAPGADGELGTDDDVCTSRTSYCTLVPRGPS